MVGLYSPRIVFASSYRDTEIPIATEAIVAESTVAEGHLSPPLPTGDNGSHIISSDRISLSLGGSRGDNGLMPVVRDSV